MEGWVWGSVEDGVEDYVSPQAVAKEKAADNAFVDYIESACIMEAGEVSVGFSET